jgi:hypothetical protein
VIAAHMMCRGSGEAADHHQAVACRSTHPLPASPEVRWAEEVDDDIAPLLGESYQDWRRGKRRRAICAQMNSRGGTRRRGEFVDLAPWPESEDWKGEIEEL